MTLPFTSVHLSPGRFMWNCRWVVRRPGLLNLPENVSAWPATCAAGVTVRVPTPAALLVVLAAPSAPAAACWS